MSMLGGRTEVAKMEASEPGNKRTINRSRHHSYRDAVVGSLGHNRYVHARRRTESEQ